MLGSAQNHTILPFSTLLHGFGTHCPSIQCTLVFGLMQSRDGHKFENWSIIGTSCQYLAAYATLRWLVAHACGACLLGALHCLHRVFSGVLHFGTAMRRWVTHLPRDLRPRHFLFAPRLQTVHLEVEVKRESFREPFFAMFQCSFIGFFVRGQYQDASSLFARV